MLLTKLRTMLLLAAIPTLALWSLEHLAGVGVSNAVRFAGAVPLGAAIGGFVTAWVAGAPFDDHAAPAIH